MDHVKWEIKNMIFAEHIMTVDFAQMINCVDGVEVLNNACQKTKLHANVHVNVLNNGFTITNNVKVNISFTGKPLMLHLKLLF